MNASHAIEFNGQDFRIVESNEHGDRIVRGVPSQDLQLVLRSACADLGGRFIVLPVKVAPR